MGAGNFDIPNITIGGGSWWEEFQQLIRQFVEQSSQGRAGLGSSLFSSLLGAQLEAQRRPISLVDQLLLSGEVGSVFPLSQANQEQRGRYTSAPQSNLMQDLQRRLGMFSVGALTPQQQVGEGYNPLTGTPLTQPEREYIRADARNRGLEPGQFQDEPRAMQYGGRMRIDPNQVVSTPRTVAGPASVVDRTGRSVARIGEAGRAEDMTVSPRGGYATTSRAPGGTMSGPYATTQSPSGAILRPDEQIRFDEITRVRPELPVEVRVSIAQNPGGFEQYVGVQTDPRAAGSRLIGGAISGDARYSPGLQRSLALGRAPSPGELTARDFTSLPPDLQEALMSVIGPDLFRQFAHELSAMTPRGLRTGIAGPVRAAA